MGRNKKYQTEEERLEAKRKREAEYYQANKLKRSLYYKERYKKLKEGSITPSATPPTEEEVEEVRFEAFDDDSAGNYEGTII